MITVKPLMIHIMHLLALVTVAIVIGCSGDGDTVGCSENEYSAGIERIGVLRSTDHGATWTFLGHACFHAPTLTPVDPSPLAVDEGIALYFLDLTGLGKPDTPRVIYRAVTTDGLLFSQPVPAFSYPVDMTDPYVLQMPNGGYRMYVQAQDGSIISAWSTDSREFILEDGVRTTAGGIPGALVTPDQKIRLFLCGGWEGQPGILSALSNDGLTFELEQGLRIPTGQNRLVADPHPIRLQGGGYLMSYVIVPPNKEPPKDNEIHIATSSDGFIWTENPGSLIVGANPGLVETADGTLYIFFVDFHASDR